MTEPPASPAPGAEPPATEGAPAVSAGAARTRWLTRVWDRIPTGWFAGILTAAFLGATAAFGGLAAVAAPEIPELTAGETHENAQFAITLERAVLIDELPEAGIYIEEGSGERVLAVVLTVENVWTQAQPSNSSGGEGGVVGAVRIPQLDEPAAAIARFDDTTGNPYLQPGVPAQVVLTWAVDADEFADGDELRLDLRDFTLNTGRLVTYGQWWDDPVTAARATLEITDVGAGADAEGGPSEGDGE